MSEALSEFIKDSYRAGKRHSEIKNVLKENGWDKDIIDNELNRFVDHDFPVAIPKPQVFASPRLIVLNLFYFLVLYLSIYYTVATLFTFLDYYLPDGLGRKAGTYYSSYRPLNESIRWYLAAIICSVPLVVISGSIIRKAIAETNQHIPIIRLKLIYLTIFIGACVMLGNITGFVYYFLSGELGIRFIIKMLLLTILIIGLYLFYKNELKQSETKV